MNETLQVALSVALLVGMGSLGVLYLKSSRRTLPQSPSIPPDYPPLNDLSPPSWLYCPRCFLPWEGRGQCSACQWPIGGMLRFSDLSPDLITNTRKAWQEHGRPRRGGRRTPRAKWIEHQRIRFETWVAVQTHSKDDFQGFLYEHTKVSDDEALDAYIKMRDKRRLARQTRLKQEEAVFEEAIRESLHLPRDLLERYQLETCLGCGSAIWRPKVQLKWTTPCVCYSSRGQMDILVDIDLFEDRGIAVKEYRRIRDSHKDRNPSCFDHLMFTPYSSRTHHPTRRDTEPDFTPRYLLPKQLTPEVGERRLVALVHPVLLTHSLHSKDVCEVLFQREIAVVRVSTDLCIPLERKWPVTPWVADSAELRAIAVAFSEAFDVAVIEACMTSDLVQMVKRKVDGGLFFGAE